MNPAWDLLPFNQLCRILARKTGQEASTYAGWTRDAIKVKLQDYDTTDSVVIQHQASLDADQLAKVRHDLEIRIDQRASEEYDNVNHSFSLLKREILEAIASSRRVETRTVILDRRTDPERITELGRQHRDFETMLSLMDTKQNVFLVGPAGSGKTSAAMAAAKALDLPFYFNGAIDSEYKLLGFTDAQGRVVHRPFRKAFTEGGLYLFDEVDASLPSAVLAFNAALANDRCDFPDGCFERHPNFYCLAAGNTFYGADHHYVGRMKQDAAFLDRFLVLDWHYDLDLEKDLATDLWPEDESKALDWFEMIISTRDKAADIGLQVVISPRATLGGVKLLRSGVSWATAVRVTLRKTMNLSDWEKIEKYTDEPAEQAPEPKKDTWDDIQKEVEEPTPDVPKPPQPWTPPQPQHNPNFTFRVKSHGKTHRNFYKDLL